MPKDSFFTPIDLPDPPVEDVTADPTEENWPTPKQFGPILDRIAVEVGRIREGTSELVPGGIHWSTGIQQRPSGFQTVFNKFKTTPNKENMEEFLAMVQQDIGLRVRREFKKWLNLILEDDDE
jgi:hypothetical protein